LRLSLNQSTKEN